MFLPTRNFEEKIEKVDEFTRPVESIMRCEDFKSNFARRLSNRYISKSPVATLKQDTALKLAPAEPVPEPPPAVLPKVAHSNFVLLKTNKVEQNGEVVKPPDKASIRNEEIRSAEISALNMEVETLRWQLSQTEANRQMHLALLKQIVSFLNRVKEHIVCQAQEASSASGRLQPRPCAADLPRSHSVLHVSKNLDYSLTPTKKLSTRKISKSISNVNGCKDYGMAWNESKLSLNQESETAHKIAEEISRLITLASTVLSTKLPDLSSCGETETSVDDQKVGTDKVNSTKVQTNSDSYKGLDIIEIDSKKFAQTSCDDVNIYEEVADVTCSSLPTDFVSTTSLVSCGSENDFYLPKLNNDKEKSPVSIRSMSGGSRTPKIMADKREFRHVANFIEDESGFSSMSSFQEIGIPIINIIPPTPCKEVTYPIGDLGIMDSGDKWKAALDLEKQTVQVFWV